MASCPSAPEAAVKRRMLSRRVVPAALLCLLAACSPSPEEPRAHEAPSATASSPSATPEGPEDKAGRAEFRRGLEDLVLEIVSREDLVAAGVGEEEIDRYFACLTDETYPELGGETIDAIAGGQGSATIGDDDREVLLAAVHECAAR